MLGVFQAWHPEKIYDTARLTSVFFETSREILTRSISVILSNLH